MSNSDKTPWTYFRYDPLYGYGINYGYGEGYRTFFTGYTPPCCAPSYTWDQCCGGCSTGPIPGYYTNRSKYIPSGCLCNRKRW